LLNLIKQEQLGGFFDSGVGV